MKITPEIIDKSVFELIDLLCLWEIGEGPDPNDSKPMCIGYIQGMADLAKKLKGVLKS